MKMIVGLGNPGKKYDRTKHNVGFTVVDTLSKRLNQTLSKQDFEAQFTSFIYNGEKVFLVKPLTYMNDSGRAVGPLLHYYQMAPSDLLVIQDDMDMPLGKLRFRDKGASGGHNGIKSIIAAVQTEQFNRLKVGIQHPDRSKVVDWVLTPFNKDDLPIMLAAFDRAAEAAISWLDGHSANDIMNRFNG
ncbi:aminoacyl-tRNA hydrolase [Agrilactobacillus fermenti]|uniref:aminoacyl-tRNA hydrolase n=1 Tax=Agrilactobacillus fermenti TaxID=2586909 RepID=UPI001E5BD570|nr:aminoacyl-tRNA hydrolase [Agrilactobacillus fermenti]MCD2255947.1 aminoacyl-tRNA hydrolase [Agrilactobacillus fermenti]